MPVKIHIFGNEISVGAHLIIAMTCSFVRKAIYMPKLIPSGAFGKVALAQTQIRLGVLNEFSCPLLSPLAAVVLRPILRAAKSMHAMLVILLTLIGAEGAMAQGDLEGRLSMLLDQWRTERGITGATMAVAAPDNGVFELASGLAVVESDTAMTPDHRFLISSMTKSFVAAVVLQLVDEGELALDDNLDRWVPEAPNAASITIRQLLNHTSGVPDYMTPDIREQFGSIAIERHANGGPAFTPRELLDIANAMPPAFEPGTSFPIQTRTICIWGASSS